jgi:three-Cys-motif partner protein
MAHIDHHDEPFDENTITKLEIFEDYASAWIPTFVMMQVPEICIFDFFAGTGYDKNGVAGSPIRTLEKILDQKGNLFQKNVTVNLFLNEFKKEKFEQLKIACQEFLEKNKGLEFKVKVQYLNEDFELLFPKLLPRIKKHPSLVYLDQNGIKFLSDKYFLELEKTKQTDFLYFVSSSYFWRFGDKEEFQMHLDIDMAEAKKQKYSYIHKSITEQIRHKLPNDSKLKLYPFSLKKGANIHGIIFGASHPRAVDKFLGISWKRNEVNGDANFDIDEDNSKDQMDLFAGKKMTKIEGFKNEIKELVLTGQICNNRDLIEYTHSQGHIPKHSADCLKELKKDNKITYDSSSPLVTYENVYKKKRLISYKIVEQ